MRSLVRLVALAVAAVTLALGPSAATAVPSATVVPTQLPPGAAPRVAYVDHDGHLVLPDGRALAVGNGAWSPVRVRGGYLVATAAAGPNPYAEDLVLVTDGGAKRVFWHQTANGGFKLGRSVVSSDGRLIALVSGALDRNNVVVAVRRVADGRRLALRTHFGGQIVAFHGHRVLVLRGPARASGRPTLVWWNVDTNRMSRALVGSRYTLDPRWTDYRGNPWLSPAAADLPTHRVALPAGKREIVRPLPGHRGRAWRTSTGELVQSWSPDGRFVLTALPPDRRMGLYETATIRIRRAGTGALVSQFRGLIGIDSEWHRTPVWESAGTFLATAWSGALVQEDWDGLTGDRTIRCAVRTATCRTVLPDRDADGDRAVGSPFALRPSR